MECESVSGALGNIIIKLTSRDSHWLKPPGESRKQGQETDRVTSDYNRQSHPLVTAKQVGSKRRRLGQRSWRWHDLWSEVMTVDCCQMPGGSCTLVQAQHNLNMSGKLCFVTTKTSVVFEELESQRTDIRPDHRDFPLDFDWDSLGRTCHETLGTENSIFCNLRHDVCQEVSQSSQVFLLWTRGTGVTARSTTRCDPAGAGRS